MKQIIIILLILSQSFVLTAQTNYSGIYGFQDEVYDPGFDIKPGKEDGGRFGELILIQAKDDLYKFWLETNRGWPSYNMGYASGFVRIVNGRGLYIVKEYMDEDTCKIFFRCSKDRVEIDNTGINACGFGANVTAEGYYDRKPKKLTDAYVFASGEGELKTSQVSTNMAYVYEDSLCTIPKKQYFIQGDKLHVIEELSKSYYIEFISKNGKFVYGWMRKNELK
ncbi:MAG: hypothetical protein JNJ58_01960 [Chitinophagaceae bacterium]|nr:hypothetical protein [Chitinophagaceae bacterium]